MSNPSPFAELSNEQLEILHATSEAFEKELRQGELARIEDFLVPIADDLHQAVFCELLVIELEWRKLKNSMPAEGLYRARFPEYGKQIKQLFQAEHDATLVSRVQGESDNTSGFTNSNAVHYPATGSVIDDRYWIVEQIGEGGMGAVFLAEQVKPVERQVAIKFIKCGLDSQAVKSRFDAERQSLAMMDHPNIARVFDGGQTPSGLPYFVMELVRGVPITGYCDAQRLDLRTRLKLFIAVCHAVQHAHLKGIIHRDLKPGNILVTELDGRPVPKVIDFGVAKAIDQRQDSGHLARETIVGTPAYMSPEQADPVVTDIDTRTDVYSLGVVLFELLIGSPPHDTGSLPRDAILESLHASRQVDSPRPSTKVKSSASLSKVAASRNVAPKKLIPMLRGELDWIAIKALENDRDRRYETVSGLARDIERYLAGELVEARPSSKSYRVKKFVHRYQGQVLAASLLLLTLTGGIIGTTWGLLEARKHEQAARNELVAKELALESEVRERKFADAISEFVENDFLAMTSLEGRLDFDDQKSGLNKDSTLRDLLDRAAAKLNVRHDLEPRIEARLRMIIGKSYLYLGAFQAAVDSYQRSAQLNAQVFGKDNLTTLQAQLGLGKAWQENGQHDAAQSLLEELVTRSNRLLGDRHEQTLDSLQSQANNCRRLGEPQKAIAILEATLDQRKTLLGPHAHDVLTNMFELALALNDADQSDKAVILLEQTLPLQLEHLGAEHPDVHASTDKLAELHLKFGDFQKAKPLLESSLEWSIANYGPEDHNTIYTMSRLGKLYRDVGEIDKAIPLAERNLELAKKAFGNEHPNVANALSDLAMTYRAAEEHIKALPLFEESMERRKASFGIKHPGTLISMLNVASGLKATGELEKAQELNAECLTIAREVLGENHSTTMMLKQNLAAGYWTAKKLELSVPLFEEVLKYRDEKYGRSHVETLMAVANLGVNYRDAGRLSEALPLLEEAHAGAATLPALKFVEIELLDAWFQTGSIEKADALLAKLMVDTRDSLLPESLALSGTWATLGKLLLRVGRFKEAEPILREALEIRQHHEPGLWRTWNTAAMLGEVLVKQDKLLDAEPLLVTAIEGMQSDSKATQVDRAQRRNEVVRVLIELLKSLDRTEEAAAWEARISPSN